jgi:glycerophosphoryl diester phosphodiesterase
MRSALAVLKPTDAVPLIELKKASPTDTDYSKLLARIDGLDMRSRVIVSSFSSSALDGINRRALDIKLALVRSAIDADPVAAAQPVHADLYLIRHDQLTVDGIAALHDAGVSVFAWTVNDPNDWSRLTDMGVDGIITNKPSEYQGWLLARGCFNH